MAIEHAALVRQLGRAQTAITQMQNHARTQLLVLEQEVSRLRGHLLVARTALFWRLPVPPPENLAAAKQVVCNTGCVGHAHHWLGSKGECRLNGEACTRV